MVDADDPKVGQLLLGRYRIIKRLGEGGMGAVYEGKHELIGKRLAIKCLHPQFMSNEEVVERFHREAHAATAVGNEHIIEVTDVGSFDDGSPFMVMEYLEGHEFGALLDTEGPMPISRLVHIVGQVCGALAAAHARGIVHRDMKPENVYLIRRGNDDDFVKVLDFGISKIKESSESLGEGSSLTKTGMALGTPYYMPPEQAQGLRDIDHRADIYAVGVILYQGLSGRLPFDAESYPALMVKIMTELPRPLAELREDIPDALQQIVYKAMEKDRDIRFQTIEELAMALQPFAALDFSPKMLASVMPPAELGTTPFSWSEKPRGETTAPPPSDGSSKAIVLAAAVIAVVGIAALFFALGRTPAAPESAEPAMSVAAARPVEPAAATQAADLPQGIAVPQKPKEVQVMIAAEPNGARIYIGDVEFPNPMDAFRPRSLDPVRIRVEADGHKAVEQLAIFDQNRSIAFTLEKGKGVKRLAPLQGPSRPARPATPAPKPAQPAVTTKPAAAIPKPTPVVKDEVYRGPTGTIREDF